MTEANPNYYSQPTAPEPAQGQDNARPVPQPPAPTQYGTVEAILAAPDISEEDMFIPEWNCTIRIRSLTKAQQHAIRSEASRGQKNQEPNPERVEMLMFLSGVTQPQFSREHYSQLLNKNTGVIDRVIQKIAKLSGADPKAVEEAKAQFQEG